MINPFFKNKGPFKIEKLDPILKDYSKENSISFVIDKKTVVVGSTELDITEVILKLINENFK